jgi:hypothetical protein
MTEISLKKLLAWQTNALQLLCKLAERALHDKTFNESL